MGGGEKTYGIPWDLELILYRILPREVDPLVFNMTTEDPGEVSYSSVGGLSEQIRELREVGSKKSK